jgi:hypothetical protein
MMKLRVRPMAIGAVVLAGLASIPLAAQDKETVAVPGGLAMSEFRGYEAWPAVAVSQPEGKLNVIVANPTMIEAYLAGIPGNGSPFPDGSMMAKIAWNSRQSEEAPFPVAIPDTLSGVGFMVKDSARFADTGGWGYAQFDYDAATRTFTPNTELQGNDAACGAACHTIAEAKDFVFTEYGAR